MNFSDLAENLGLEEHEFLEMVELYLETTLSDLGKLESGIDEKNIQIVIEAAHSIKGASANLGFMEAHTVSKKIEEEAQNGFLEGLSQSTQNLKRKVEFIAELARNR